jgi:hypothetical protein
MKVAVLAVALLLQGCGTALIPGWQERTMADLMMAERRQQEMRIANQEWLRINAEKIREEVRLKAQDPNWRPK